MKKTVTLLLITMLIFGSAYGLPVQAAELSYGTAEMEQLGGAVWTGGDVIRAEDCAIMLSYRFENADGTEEGMEALCDAVHAYAKSQGYDNMMESTDSDKAYFLNREELECAVAIVLGEEWEYAVEAGQQGMSRRFAHSYMVWSAWEDAAGWRAVSVEKQDHYEGADGNQYPCYYIELAPWYESKEEQGSAVRPQGEESKPAACDHVFDYVVEKEPVENLDGILAKKCEKCGSIVEYQPISAISAFLRNAEKSVKSAAQGAAVTIETDRWLCFDQRVMEAIASRPDVTVTVNYRYEHRSYTVTIPAGYDVISLLNEEGFCGFRYLDLIFEGKEIVTDL